MFPGFKTAVKEFYRILKPEGKLLINLSSEDQMFACWWSHLWTDETHDY